MNKELAGKIRKTETEREKIENKKAQTLGNIQTKREEALEKIAEQKRAAIEKFDGKRDEATADFDAQLKEKDDYLKVLYELKKQQDKLEMQMEAMNEKISQA